MFTYHYHGGFGDVYMFTVWRRGTETETAVGQVHTSGWL